MRLTDVRGLRYPDEFVIKWFFEEGLHLVPGKVLELGCANGNNLALFYQFGWDVTGVDISARSLDDAAHNFPLIPTDGGTWRFVQHNIANGVSAVARGPFSCLSLANIICYLERAPYMALLEDLRRVLTPGSAIFLRARTPRDYRYGRGVEIGRNSYRLTINETGERDCVMTFYDEHEIVSDLVRLLDVDPQSLVVLQVNFQNLQQRKIISSSDVVMWGRQRV